MQSTEVRLRYGNAYGDFLLASTEEPVSLELLSRSSMNDLLQYATTESGYLQGCIESH